MRAQQQANALRQWDLHVAACKELHRDNGWNNPFIQFLTSQGNFFRFLPFIRRHFCVYPINKTYLLFDDTFLRFNSIIFHLVLILILSCAYITIKKIFLLNSFIFRLKSFIISLKQTQIVYFRRNASNKVFGAHWSAFIIHFQTGCLHFIIELLCHNGTRGNNRNYVSWIDVWVQHSIDISKQKRNISPSY